MNIMSSAEATRGLTLAPMVTPWSLLLCLSSCSRTTLSRYHRPNSLSLGAFLAAGAKFLLISTDLGLSLDLGLGGATLLFGGADLLS